MGQNGYLGDSWVLDGFMNQNVFIWVIFSCCMLVMCTLAYSVDFRIKNVFRFGFGSFLFIVQQICTCRALHCGAVSPGAPSLRRSEVLTLPQWLCTAAQWEVTFLTAAQWTKKPHLPVTLHCGAVGPYIPHCGAVGHLAFVPEVWHCGAVGLRFPSLRRSGYLLSRISVTFPVSLNRFPFVRTRIGLS